MHSKVIAFNLNQRAKEMPDIRTGDVIRVYRKIQEEGKERVQMFEGTVIAKKGGQSSSPMITVRKSSFGIGAELILPMYSPSIDRIEFVKRTKTTKSKLYFVREKSEKKLRKKLRVIAVKEWSGKKKTTQPLAEKVKNPTTAAKKETAPVTPKEE